MSDCSFNCDGGELDGFGGMGKTLCPKCSELAASASSPVVVDTKEIDWRGECGGECEGCGDTVAFLLVRYGTKYCWHCWEATRGTR